MQSGENAELLLSYCARTLDAGAAAAMERHVAECAQCGPMAEAQKAVWAALDSWEALPVSEDFDRRLFEKLDEDRRRPFWRALMPRLEWKPAFGLAAAGLSACAFLLMRQQPPAIEPASEVFADTVDVEQVERTLEDLDMLRQFEALRAEASDAKTL
jgi:hypothetical protein